MKGAQVLGPAQDVEEGLGVVQGHLVELGHGHIGKVPPGDAFVEGLVEAGVGAHQEMPSVLLVDPEGVVVAVGLPARSQVVEGSASVPGHLDEDVHLVDQVRVRRRGIDLLVVVGSGAAGDVPIPPLPALPLVPGAIEPLLPVPGLDGGIDQGGIRRRHRQADLPHVAGGQPRVQLPPAVASVRGLVDTGTRPAGQVSPDMASALEGGGVENVRVLRVELHVRHAGVLVHLENRGPARSPVGGPEEAPVAAGGPEGPLRGDEDHVSVPGIHQDLPDMLRAPEPHVLPGATGVPAQVHPVSPGHVAAADVLSRPHPHHVGVVGVQGDVADGVGSLLVEDGGPGGSGVGGSPEAPGSHCHEPCRLIGGAHLDVGNAPSHDGGPHLPQGHARGGPGHSGLLRVSTLGPQGRSSPGRLQTGGNDRKKHESRPCLRDAPAHEHVLSLLLESPSGRIRCESP